jgi:4-azaleucine resistance transporter AzlC
VAKHKIIRAARAAFPFTLPIMAGFLFLGMAYGILMRSVGFGPWYPILMSVVIFAGAMQFVAVNLFTQPFAPVNALALTLLVNARHMFYGLSLLDTYREVGKKKWYLIYALCDETFSIACSVEVPDGVDRGWFYFFVSFCNNSYWIIGTAIGAFSGGLLPFDLTGIDFAMTALFLVIFVNRWEAEEHHISSLCGLGVSILCLILFGPDKFIVASMAGMLVILTALRRPIDRREGLS